MSAHLRYLDEKGPLGGLVLNFEKGGEWVIGRDPDLADILIEDPIISREHFRVTKAPEGFYLQNISQTNVVRVNGVEHEERVLLHEGDKVQIGHLTFMFSEEKEKSGYDDIFGDLDELPPAPKAPDRDEEILGEEDKYQTVFEDLEEPSELPLHLTEPPRLFMQVLSGPYAGQPSPLQKGHTYIIGRDPNKCDKILSDDLSVSHEHAQLSISEDGALKIKDLGSKNGTLVNGKAITEETEIVAGRDQVTLGTTSFRVVDREADQTTVYAILPSYEEEKEEEAAAMPAIIVEEMDWRKKPLPTKHLVAGAGFLIIFFVIFMSFFSLFKSSQIEETHKDPSSRVKEALSKYPDVQFSFNPEGGKLFLVGHVTTSVEYQEMIFRLGEVPFIRDVENNVVIDDLVSSSSNNVISNNPDWRAVTIRSSGPGKFEAVGYVQSADQSAALQEFLTVNFPYLERLTNNVVVEDNLLTQVSALLAQDFGGISPQLIGSELVLSGTYSSKMESEYKKMLKTLNTLPGMKNMKIINNAVASSTVSSGIDISQSYQVSGSAITEGPEDFAQINGKIYKTGQRIDGMTITSITKNTILLEKDGIKYKIGY